MSRITLESVNHQLKEAGCRVKVELRGNRLNLRGVLPPKPNSGKDKPYQQRINLSLSNDNEGLKEARAIALSVTSQLDRGVFDWTAFYSFSSGIDGNTSPTVEQATQRFKEEYLARRGWDENIANTYKKHYQTAFNKLPPQATLTKDLLVAHLKKTAPNTHTRLKTYLAYENLYQLIYQESLNSSHLKGNYRSKEVEPEDLPTDQQIEEARALFYRSPMLLSAFDLMAVYGLRPAECFRVDPSSLQDSRGAILVEDNKTKGKPQKRLVYPSRLHWYRDWNIPNLILPKSQARNNNYKGNMIGQGFRRAGCPFNAYMLRHAYAIFWLGKIDASIVAKWMGHSVQTHNQIYMKFLSRQRFDQIFDDYLNSGGTE
jgi:integrase